MTKETRHRISMKSMLIIASLLFMLMAAAFAVMTETGYAAGEAYVTIKVNLKEEGKEPNSDFRGRQVVLINRTGMTIYLENGSSVSVGGSIYATADENSVATFTGIPAKSVTDTKDYKYDLKISTNAFASGDTPRFMSAEINDITPVDGVQEGNTYQYVLECKRILDFIKIRVKKTDEKTGEPLAGAGFDVCRAPSSFYSDVVLPDGTVIPPGGVIQHIVTDENGYAETDQIIPNNAWIRIGLKETQVPEGYYEYSNKYTSLYGSSNDTYRMDGTDTFEVEIKNTKLGDKGGIMLRKVFVTDENNDLTAKVEITLKDKDGNPVNDTFGLGIDPPGEREIKFVDGKAVVELNTMQHSDTIFEIPAGYTFEIKELPMEGWIPSKAGTLTGTVEANMESNSGFPHYKNVYTIFNLPFSAPRSTSFKIEAKKTLTGKALENGEYSFVLKKDGKEVSASVNDKDGNVSFGTIDVSADDLRTDVDYFSATEEQRKKIKTWINVSDYGDITYITDDIPDDAYTYIEEPDGYGSVNYIKVYYKDATDEQKEQAITQERDWTTGNPTDPYYFQIAAIEALLDEEEQKTVFGILFDKTLKYTIEEVLPEGVEKSSPKKNGITYDTHTEEVTVRISGELNGELNAEVSYDEDGAVFTNKYEKPEDKKVEETPEEKETPDIDKTPEPGQEDEDEDGGSVYKGDREGADKERTAKVVKTGDDSPVMTFILLFAVSALALCIAVSKRNRLR